MRFHRWNKWNYSITEIFHLIRALKFSHYRLRERWPFRMETALSMFNGQILQQSFLQTNRYLTQYLYKTIADYIPFWDYNLEFLSNTRVLCICSIPLYVGSVATIGYVGFESTKRIHGLLSIVFTAFQLDPFWEQICEDEHFWWTQ